MDQIQKMYLVPQQQLDNMKMQSSSQDSIRQVAENELDKQIVTILNTNELDLRQKAKKYTAVLHRYLTMVRQKADEQGVLTLTLPSSENGAVTGVSAAVSDTAGDFFQFSDISSHMPQRNRRNAQHILDLLSKSKDSVSWSPQGELVVNGNIVRGSHIFDLVKNVTSSQGVSDDKRPVGWPEFLRVMAALNMPLSSVPNTHVKQLITNLKTGISTPRHGKEDDGYTTPVRLSSGKRKRKRQNMYDSWVEY